MILLLMGVSGCGKSSVAAELAALTGLPFVEGDEHHSAANRAKMAAGIPLTDDDRQPWLDELHSILATWHAKGESGILTCSALKRIYRDRLRQGLSNLQIIWLHPSRLTLIQRLQQRSGHFFAPELLESQLATLEPPTADEAAYELSGELSPLTHAVKIALEFKLL